MDQELKDEKKQNIGKLSEKSYNFAVRIVNAYKYLTQEQKEFILSKQLLRSGTSIAANCREATYAQSYGDFINKLSISLKEANETAYWIELLHDTDYISPNAYNSITYRVRRTDQVIDSNHKNIKIEE